MKELKILGRNLYHFRKKNNLSYQAIANALGLSAAHVCRIEKGTAKPSFDVMINLSQLMNVPLYYLFLDFGNCVDFTNFITSVKDKMKTLNWSLETLSKKTGINIFKMLDIIHEKIQPTQEEITALANILGLPIPDMPTNQRLSLLERILEDLGLDRAQIRNIIDYVKLVMKKD
ncbi:hypothetical protein BBF96_10640 [Anoxybacter fermentans]|uniref:HTH cro/C1-type domain-containing protein n=1 Tax=Anoxybacter fermentans TaxID=1323375 RepID=A0A3Q9HRQ1_9FIRM|nr:helix-turn-helix transcriptional regulator [Anoxybacter fermentans]AZR73802.1 hypothetical protein BBF96_10640 [Anoxybacter fermentans]